ncbi:unnamed protein product, partial [Porites evermanni]
MKWVHDDHIIGTVPATSSLASMSWLLSHYCKVCWVALSHGKAVQGLKGVMIIIFGKITSLVKELLNVTTGSPSSKYEHRRASAFLIMFYCRGSRLHYGIDINCDAGSSVHSPFSAQVIRISRTYGNGKPHDTNIYM